jgi:hypothetical protein
MGKLITGILGLAGVISIAFGIVSWGDSRYASAVEVRQNQKMTDYNFKSNSIEKANERIWQLEERIKKNPNDITAIEELKKLKEKKVIYEKDLDEISKRK